MENKAAQMDKVYNPQAIEGELYKEWEETGAFVAHRVEGKQPFTIVMPPPNITGQLHMGHAMDGVLQDSLTRYHRMKGDPTLWLPVCMSIQSGSRKNMEMQQCSSGGKRGWRSHRKLRGRTE